MPSTATSKEATMAMIAGTRAFSRADMGHSLSEAHGARSSRPVNYYGRSRRRLTRRRDRLGGAAHMLTCSGGPSGVITAVVCDSRGGALHRFYRFSEGEHIVARLYHKTAQCRGRHDESYAALLAARCGAALMIPSV